MFKTMMTLRQILARHGVNRLRWGALVLGLAFSFTATAQTITEIIDAIGDGGGNSLNQPTAITADGASNVYLAGGGISGNAFKITPGGSITEIIDATGDGGGNSLSFPQGIAVDGAGNVYVTGLGSNNAFKITPGGAIIEIIDATGDGGGNSFSLPRGIAVDGAGNVYVAGSGTNNAFQITPVGVITEIIDATGDGGGNSLSNPFGIAVDGAGNVYVTGLGSDNAFKITPVGAITEIIDATGDGGGNSLADPFGIAVDGAGNVYVTGAMSSNAFKITPIGVITEIIDATGDGGGNSLAVPRGVAVDGAGNVYVAGSGTNNAFQITPGGVITEIIDVTGDGGGNSLNQPVGIAVDGAGNAYVAGTDSDNAFKINLGPDVPPLPHEFMLLADENIKIDGQNFSEGDIHANRDIEFHDGNPSTHTGNLTAVDDIKIDKGNTIDGDITAGDNVDVDHDATVTGIVTEHATVAKIPLPTLSFTAGGDDITVEELQTLSLPPGSYDDVEVEKGAILILSHNGTTGEYFLDKLLLGKKAFLSIDASLGEVIVNVVDKLKFDKQSEVVITSPAGDSRFVTFNSLDDVTIEDDARVMGNIIVPEHKVKIEEGAVFKGAICAENIEICENVTFVHHSSTTPLPKSVAPELTYEDDEVSSDENIVDSFALEQNYPNPFNPTTVIRYQLPAASDVKLSIYNMMGQLVRTLVNGEMPAGQHSVTWNATDDNGARVATGVYLYVLRAGDPSSGSGQGFVSQKKLVLMK